jgi:hypothetical protein
MCCNAESSEASPGREEMGDEATSPADSSVSMVPSEYRLTRSLRATMARFLSRFEKNANPNPLSP